MKVQQVIDSSTNARGWSFTLNNYTINEVHSIIEGSTEKSYLIFGFEIGEKGTPHLQGYLYYPAKARLSALLKFIPRGHIEPAYSSPEKNITYCSKDGEYYEFGERPKQGRRSDLDDIAQNINNGMALEQVAENFPSQFIRYGRGIENYQNIRFKDRTEPPTIYFVYGKTGTGKTKFAYDLASELKLDIYSKDETQWWNDYKQQPICLIDEFDITFPFRTLLKLTDRYPFKVQYKFGTFVKFNSPIIIITCDRSLNDLYEDFLTPHELSQITRRISHFVEKIK